LAEVGIDEGARSIRDAGIRVSSLLRGGFFDALEPVARAERMDDNRRAVEEAAVLQARTLVLVCGPAADHDLDGARDYVAEAIAELSEFAAASGVALGIEPMHPVYCGDRSVVVTLGQALAMAEPHPAGSVGVVVDAYHVWWDPELSGQVAASRGRIFGYHVCDWLVPPPDHLNGRGMMGDGVIDLRHMRRMIDAAGYDGPIEAEVFNPTIWALPGEEALEMVCRRYLEHVVG
jgi:sugar phosphate isomerase/epimerase